MKLLILLTALGSACYLMGRERGRTELDRDLAREEAAFREATPQEWLEAGAPTVTWQGGASEWLVLAPVQ